MALELTLGHHLLLIGPDALGRNGDMMITVLMAMEMALWMMMEGREAIRLGKGAGKVQPRRDEKRYKTTILEPKIHKMG